MNVKEITLLFYDYGSYIEVAKKFTESFACVYYFNPNVHDGFQDKRDVTIGEGIVDVIKVKEWASVIDMVDMVFFSDCYEADLQSYFRNCGKLVFGSGQSSILELDRGYSKQVLEEVGLPIGPYQIVRGVNELESTLREKENVYIKSNHRGNHETTKWKNYALSKGEIRRMRKDMSIFGDDEIYILEDQLDCVAEIGSDSFCIEGQYPSTIVAGIEVKDCYDDQTEVLTDSGWKLFKDLNRTEMVLTLNISNTRHMKSEYQRPIHYTEKEYNGELIYIEKDSVSLCVTPGHNIMVQDGVQNEFAEEVEWGGKIEKTGFINRKFKRGKRILRLQKIKDVVDRKKRFSLLQPKAKFCIQDKRGNSRIKIGGVSYTKIQMASLLGLYLSEGSVSNNYITISQYKYINEFKIILDKLPVRFNKINVGFGLYDKELSNYLSQFGKAFEKYVPQWLKDSSYNVINSFLDAYCLGDGSFIKSYKKIRKDNPTSLAYPDGYKPMINRRFYTSSSKMADDIQELLVKIGNVAVSHTDRSYYNKTDNCDYLMYSVYEKLVNRKNYIFPEDIQYVPYSGKVYCVTVPNSIIMVRRNGKSMWCGNCAYLCKFMPYSELPKQVKMVMDRLSPKFEELGYRGWFSNEIIIAEDMKGYMLDFTCRMPQPPTTLLINNITNFAECAVNVASGIVPRLECKYRYGCQFILHSDMAQNDDTPLIVPKEYQSYVSLKNLYIDEEGTWYYARRGVKMREIGSVIGLGDTLKQAIDMARMIANSIQAEDAHIDDSSIDKGLESLKKLSNRGIRFI